MSRFLIVDIGAGTMDILCYDSESEQSYKAVAKSPVLSLAKEAECLSKKLLVTGCEMGGGAISTVLRERAQKVEVIMSASSAATINHNLDKERSWGIKIVEDTEAEGMQQYKNYSTLNLGDLDVDRLRHILQGLDVSFSFDIVGVCAQDHGMPPEGVSHLDYRNTIFKASLDHDPFPHALLYREDEVPETFNRLNAIATTAKNLPADEVYVMDSGMAAILGATMDPQARQKEV